MSDPICPNCQGVTGGGRSLREVAEGGPLPPGTRICLCRQETHGRINPKENLYEVPSATSTMVCPVCTSFIKLTPIKEVKIGDKEK